MEWPIVAPAPVVTEHAAVFRDLCDNPCQFRHCQPDLTGLISLPHHRLPPMARCILDRAATTHLARLLTEAPWRAGEVKRRRLPCMLQQTTPHRPRRRASLGILDATWCAHGGSLFD
jgi:hypothetical protein